MLSPLGAQEVSTQGTAEFGAREGGVETQDPWASAPFPGRQTPLDVHGSIPLWPPALSPLPPLQSCSGFLLPHYYPNSLSPVSAGSFSNFPSVSSRW